MIILSLNNINKSYGIVPILKDISMQVVEGERIGLIGRNGTGKTTLLEIISGKSQPDSGEIYIKKDATLGYLSQGLAIESNKTLWSEIQSVFQHLIDIEEKIAYLSEEMSNLASKKKPLESIMEEYTKLQDSFQQQDGYSYRSKIKGVLKGLGFEESEFHIPVTHLSGGQKTRLALARELLKEPNLLLLDEPTNYLDITSVQWLEQFLKSYKGSVIIVSHDRYFLDQVVEKIYELEDQNIIAYNGNYSSYLIEKEIRYTQALKEYNLQQNAIKKMENFIRQQKAWGRKKNHIRAASRQKMLDKIERMEKPSNYQKTMGLNLEASLKSGRHVLKVDNLSIGYNDIPLAKGLSFQIEKGDVVALVGPNGIGKTSLVKTILGQIKHLSGYYQLGHNVKLGYFDQEQTSLDNEKTVLDEIWDAVPDKTMTEIRTILGRFLFSGEEVNKTVANLSGGEKSRLALAKFMLQKANFLIMDEPTNHLDIPSKEVLEEAMLKYDGTVLIISHDRYFINKLANKVLEFSSNGIKTYLGNYDYYLEKKKELEEGENHREDGKKSKVQYKERKPKIKVNKEIEKLQEEIILLEERVEYLEQLLCKEAVYSDPQKAEEINKEYRELKEKIPSLYEKWEGMIES